MRKIRDRMVQYLALKGMFNDWIYWALATTTTTTKQDYIKLKVSTWQKKKKQTKTKRAN